MINKVGKKAYIESSEGTLGMLMCGISSLFGVKYDQKPFQSCISINRIMMG